MQNLINLLPSRRDKHGLDHQDIGAAASEIDVGNPVLVLDEATAQADPASDRDIHHALSPLAAGPTVLLNAHRLSTIRDADQILVGDAGHITGRGTHKELLAADGRYAAMWSSQDLSEETDAAALTAQVEQLGAGAAGEEEK